MSPETFVATTKNYYVVPAVTIALNERVPVRVSSVPEPEPVPVSTPFTEVVIAPVLTLTLVFRLPCGWGDALPLHPSPFDGVGDASPLP